MFLKLQWNKWWSRAHCEMCYKSVTKIDNFFFFISCCLWHYQIMEGVGGCEFCACIFCNGAEDMADRYAKQKAKALWKFSRCVYSNQQTKSSGLYSKKQDSVIVYSVLG